MDSPSSERLPKILIVRTSALGDVVHVLPSLAALRERFPRAWIAWLVEPAGAQLLSGHPSIDRLFVFDRSRFKAQWRRPAVWPGLLRDLLRLIRQVRRERFDLVVDFQCNVRSGLAVLFSGGRRRHGFSRRDSPEWGGYLFTNRKAPRCPPGLHKVEKNLWLVRSLGWEGAWARPEIAIPGNLLEWAREVLGGLRGSGPVVMVHPAVSRFGEIKRWPADRFRELIDRARAELDAKVLITWGPGEREIAESIGRPAVAPPIPSPLHLAALAACAGVVVAADTGVLHIAALLGTPLVGLYGPKNDRIYGPYPRTERTRIVRSAVPCSPCRLRRCEHRICMSMIFPEDVFLALKEILGRA